MVGRIGITVDPLPALTRQKDSESGCPDQVVIQRIDPIEIELPAQVPVHAGSRSLGELSPENRRLRLELLPCTPSEGQLDRGEASDITAVPVAFGFVVNEDVSQDEIRGEGIDVQLFSTRLRIVLRILPRGIHTGQPDLK